MTVNVNLTETTTTLIDQLGDPTTVDRTVRETRGFCDAGLYVPQLAALAGVAHAPGPRSLEASGWAGGITGLDDDDQSFGNPSPTAVVQERRATGALASLPDTRLS